MSSLVLAESMFRMKTANLLEIKAFILDFPAETARLFGQRWNICGKQCEIGQQFKFGGRITPFYPGMFPHIPEH